MTTLPTSFDWDNLSNSTGWAVQDGIAGTVSVFDRMFHVNSSDAGDGIFRFGVCVCVNTMSVDALAPKVASASSGMVLADNIWCCSRVNFNYLGQAKSKI